MKYIILLFSLSFSFFVYADTSGPYQAKVKRIQVIDIGNPFNTVWLDMDITDSTCSGTNQYNRFEIKNELQYSAVLTALMAGKEIRVYGTAECNSGSNEAIANVQVFSDK